MNVGLWFAAILSVLVIREVVTGAALVLRRQSFLHGALRAFHPELFVYREGNPVAFWIVVSIHAIVTALTWLKFWN